VAFAGDQKRAAAEMMARLAGRSPDSGTALDLAPRGRRECVVKLRDSKLDGALKDVSSTGAFIGARTVPSLTSDAS